MLMSSTRVVISKARDAKDISKAVKALKQVGDNTLIVEFDDWEPKWGVLELPQTVSERLRPTTGIVLGVGKNGCEVSVGDRVICERYGGSWFRNAWFGSYVARGQVRVYGNTSVEYTVDGCEKPLKHVLGAISEKNVIRAVEDKLLIRRDPVMDESIGGIMLTDRGAARNQKATVYSYGRDAKKSFPEIEIGVRVFYHGQALVNEIGGLAEEFNLPGDPGDYCFIRASDIYSILDESDLTS